MALLLIPTINTIAQRLTQKKKRGKNETAQQMACLESSELTLKIAGSGLVAVRLSLPVVHSLLQHLHHRSGPSARPVRLSDPGLGEQTQRGIANVEFDMLGGRKQ